MNIRVGFGYDVHKLVENRDLWLGGIKIDYELGLDNAYTRQVEAFLRDISR
jgi:2C-methyl-D-erythritol 2,4-cyclodiphosphate synthase